MRSIDIVRQRLRWLRDQARDTVELYLLPGLVIFLPWPWSFALFKHIVKVPALYREDAVPAMANAQRFGLVDDPVQWLRCRKLVALVDHADHFLARTRSNRWMARYIDVQGAWPVAGIPGMLCTFHWGAGMWSLRHARQAGMNAHSLVAPMDGTHFNGRPVLHAYIQSRVKTVSIELGVDALDVSQSMKPALKALRSCEQVLAAIDVPADSVDASVDTEILGVRMRMPKGLLRVAADHGLPVTLFMLGLDVHTGRRTLRLLTLPVETNTEQLAQNVFRHLDDAIRSDPWAWHFWSQINRFVTTRGLSHDA